VDLNQFLITWHVGAQSKYYYRALTMESVGTSTCKLLTGTAHFQFISDESICQTTALSWVINIKNNLRKNVAIFMHLQMLTDLTL